VYEKAHRVSEDVTLQHGKLKAMNKDVENHPYLGHAKQKTETVKSHVLHPESSFLHRKRERERGVQVLDPKGLIGTQLGNSRLGYNTYILNLS
jgi:hypothetical protein